MTEGTHDLLANANKGRLSTIKNTLSDSDVSSVWDNVSSYLEKQLTQQKGVSLPGLGVLTISQKKLDIGNNKFVLTQRPVFNISEKFASTHALQFQKYHVPGSIPVIPLNFSSISFESPFDRDTVERCFKEIISSLNRALASKRNIELCFNGIGRLTIREGRVKMKFYKEFINEMDASGKLVDSMMNRMGTVDSVMSDRMSSRPATGNTLILPKIGASHNGNLTPLAEQEEEQAHIPHPPDAPHAAAHVNEIHLYPDQMEGGAAVLGFVPQQDDPTARKEGMEGPEADFATEHAVDNILRESDVPADEVQPSLVAHTFEQDLGGDVKPTSGSRQTLQMATANGISLTDDLNMMGNNGRQSGMACGGPAVRMSHSGEAMPGLKPPSPPRLAPLHRSRSLENLHNGHHAAAGPPSKGASPPGTACGHPSAGQELCYLCHQRARMNVPVSFTEERKKREAEEDRLLQQYQTMKDAEETLANHEKMYARRHDLQKVSAFNLGVAEAVHDRKKMKDTEPQRAYIFNRRPLTPSRLPKQVEYLQQLDTQVYDKEKAKVKRKTDEAFLERLEQVQLAEDLALQREQYLRDKADGTDTYKKALEAQLRFKPLPMPPREPDNEVFGKNDTTNEKMAERRRRAYNLYQEQQGLVETKKRDAILARLAEQHKEDEVLDRAKKDLVDERAFKHHVRFDSRRRLETNWQKMAEEKRARELEDKLRSLDSGILLHEQCDQYNRCKQCKRRVHNCGETNIWSESRYIPGSRIMV